MLTMVSASANIGQPENKREGEQNKKWIMTPGAHPIR